MKPPSHLGDTVVRSLTRGEATTLGDVIADSHADYPSFAHLFPDPAQRTRVLRTLMAGVARDASAHGTVTVTSRGDRILGAAVWLSPGRFPWSRWRKARSAGTFLPLLWQARGSVADFFESGRNAEEAAPTEPHWNLQVLGIRREAQRQGYGARLLQPVLAQADREGTLCYLETADPTNLGFYERFGFVPDRTHRLVPDGPPHLSMRRPPQGLPDPRRQAP